ncbi:lytic transglycosylase domain-containing protein [Aeromonas sp. FDAARGOS 1407]|uniref:lytic transglycosylase domain-containing protein n=1 Tax=Aeromonas TaxID=642 RepID=UPI001C239417|nr:lytic transglycosylase domain-containing protein [Aeromonas sp. FDAARGOS 1407]QXC36162.1 lytic transglycosylase domain-containing protein [Aeromonas sp. FDAARGOS 1407]
MSIKIPISADFNGDDVKKQIAQINTAIKSMGEAVAKANGQKFEPIKLSSKDDLKFFIQQSEKLLKIQGELNNRMKRSGQEGKNPFMANWSQLYLNETTRLKKQQEALVFLGASFEGVGSPRRPDATPPHRPINRTPTGGSGGGSSQWAQQGAKVLQSGLNAAGPVGGVVSNALGTGMSAGFGAGLAGLAGGMAALGVGKLIGAIADKVSDAQVEAIMNDALMRRLGGGVGYLPIREGLRGASSALGISYNEGQQLASQLARTGNLGGDRASELPAELLSAGGFSRGFGVDPATGVGLFGSLRGLRLTGSDQDSRKVGLIIGETIARSDAFAKVEDVMEAIGGYASSQTRQSLGVLNLAGYSGQLSAMAGSGIPGLDVTGSASLLARVNATLAAGGANGEASQFFSSMVANRMGLDPIQMAIMREGGAFATNSQMFGSGSMAARYGISGPGGNSTFLQETLGTLRSKYGNNRGLLAQATANHLGVGINQAMALLSINPNEMGGIQSRVGRLGVDMSNLDATGIADLGRIETADGTGLKRIANQYLGRTGKGALTADEARDLKAAMEGGDQERIKDSLAKLAAAKGAIETEGSKTRDTIANVSNIMQKFASESLPILNESRAALLFLAGQGGAKGPRDLLERAMQSRHDENVDVIKQKYRAQINEQVERSNRARIGTMGVPVGDEVNLPRDQQGRAIIERQARAKAEMDAASAEIKRLETERDKELAAEDARLKAEREQEQRRQEKIRDSSNWTPGSSPINHEAIAIIESGGRHYDRAGNIITSSAGALGRMQTMPGTLKDPGFGVTPARDNSPEEMERVGKDYIDAMYEKYGDIEKALAAYNWGPGRLDDAIKKHGDSWRRYAPTQTQQYIRKYHRTNDELQSRSPAAMPAQVPADEQYRRQSSGAPVQHGPLSGEVSVNLSMNGDLRRILNPPEPLVTKVTSNWYRHA